MDILYILYILRTRAASSQFTFVFKIPHSSVSLSSIPIRAHVTGGQGGQLPPPPAIAGDAVILLKNNGCLNRNFTNSRSQQSLEKE